MASLDAETRQCEESPGYGEAWSDGKSDLLGQERSDGRDSAQKTRFCVRSPSVVEQNVKRKPEMNLEELPKTASLEQVTTLMHELKQQDVCDMKVDLAEVMWQDSDATVRNTLAHELETVIECLSAEEDDVEDIEMPGDELRDESEGEDCLADGISIKILIFSTDLPNVKNPTKNLNEKIEEKRNPSQNETNLNI